MHDKAFVRKTDYDKLKEAFEEAISELSEHITYTPYDFDKNVEYWRRKAGLLD